MPFFIGALKYPAAGGVGYPNSVDAGRAALVAELNYLSTYCPNNYVPAVVLGGHSQGAAVVLAALIDATGQVNLTPRARAMVRAAFVYGDPLYSRNRSINAPGAQNSNIGLFGERPAVWQTQLDNLRKWGWPQGASAQGWVQKVRSYCSTQDFFCASGTQSNSMSIHNLYGENTTNTAWSWVQYMISSPN